MDSSRAVKLILTYDIRPSVQDEYFQFMLGEMVPTLQAQGLHMNGAWHTAYGNYPMRLVEFIAEDRETLDSVLGSSIWEELEAQLRRYVQNFSYKTVRLREDMFQF
jgi:hypothetical protein